MDCIRVILERPTTLSTVNEAIAIVGGRQRGLRIEAEALKKRLPQIAAEGTDEAFRVAVARLHTIELALRQCNNARSYLNVGLAAFHGDSWPRIEPNPPGSMPYRESGPDIGPKDSKAGEKIAPEETQENKVISSLMSVEIHISNLRRAITDTFVQMQDQKKSD